MPSSFPRRFGFHGCGFSWSCRSSRRRRARPRADRASIEPPALQIASSEASTQDVSPLADPIEPDRPDVTNGTHIVDVGLLQVEVGVQQDRIASQRNTGTPLTLRVGLLDWLELRAGTDGFLHQSDAVSSVNGMGNVQLGAKIRLFADPGGIPVLSVLPTVNLPVASASKGLGTGDSDYTLVVLTGTGFGQDLTR